MLLDCRLLTRRWPLKEPFRISRGTMADVPVLEVQLQSRSGQVGRAEAYGIPYEGETPESMAAQVEAVRAALHEDLTAAELSALLPAAGARNALDCALWDLRAKQAGQRIWELLGLPAPRPVMTAYTLGLGTEEDLRRKLRQALHMPLLKLKANADEHLNLVRIAKEEHPQARIVVDANQAWSRELLERLLPPLREWGVELIEQPVPRGTDEQLDGLRPLIPLAADESCADRGSLAALVGRYRFVNIKLDKTGGLTEALAVADEAQRMGFELMVGNMCGSSLAMAPAFLIAQRCRYVDLDGPLLQSQDCDHAMRYDGAALEPPAAALWG